jgi:putative copper resistance protein D
MPVALIARGIARGLHVAASLSVFGSALCYACITARPMQQLPPATMHRAERLSAGLLRLSLAVAVVAGAIWLLLEAVYVADTDRIADAVGALAPLLYETNFGQLLALRLALLLLAVIVFGDGANRSRAAVAAALSAVAVALEAGLGHGAAMGNAQGQVLLVALVFHLLAAGAWLGGLLPLLIAIDAFPAAKAQELALRFSILGTVCVLIMAITAAVQGWGLLGGLAGLFETAYGRIALAKLMLFGLLLGFAAANRLRFTPALTHADTRGARRQLHRSIVAETLAGLIVIVLAGVLLNLPPGITMTTKP